MVPYIGVAGLSTRHQAEALIAQVPPNHSRSLALGVLVSERTLCGQQNSMPHLFPPVESLRKLLVSHNGVLSTVHFGTRGYDTLAEQLLALIKIAGPNLGAVQLNLAWPSPDQLHRLDEMVEVHGCARPNLILQIGREAQKLRGGPSAMARRLRTYEGLIDAVLIDTSGGSGTLFDLEHSAELLDAVRCAVPWIGVGLAGGIGPDNLERLIPLLRRCPDLSIDSQKLLRTPDDHLDIEAACLYTSRAFRMFAQVGSPPHD